MDKIASQIKVLLLFGMVGVNEVGIRWKDNALIRGGLTDASNSFFLRKKRSKACREKSAEAIVPRGEKKTWEGLNNRKSIVQTGRRSM